MYFPTQHILMSNNVLCVKENTSLQVTYKKLGENYQHFYCRFKKKQLKKKSDTNYTSTCPCTHNDMCSSTDIFSRYVSTTVSSSPQEQNSE